MPRFAAQAIVRRIPAAPKRGGWATHPGERIAATFQHVGSHTIENCLVAQRHGFTPTGNFFGLQLLCIRHKTCGHRTGWRSRYEMLQLRHGGLRIRNQIFVANFQISSGHILRCIPRHLDVFTPVDGGGASILMTPCHMSMRHCAIATIADDVDNPASGEKPVEQIQMAAKHGIFGTDSAFAHLLGDLVQYVESCRSEICVPFLQAMPVDGDGVIPFQDGKEFVPAKIEQQTPEVLLLTQITKARKAQAESDNKLALVYEARVKVVPHQPVHPSGAGTSEARQENGRFRRWRTSGPHRLPHVSWFGHRTAIPSRRPASTVVPWRLE